MSRPIICDPAPIRSDSSMQCLAVLICCVPDAAGQMPDVYHDTNGRPYLMTKGKEKVSVAQDQYGNVFLVDRNGNMYYDTGDKRFGMLMVSYSRRALTLLYHRAYALAATECPLFA